MGIFLGLVRAIGPGILACVTPRLLVALGVPLEEWITYMCAWLRPAVAAGNNFDAMMVATLMCLFMFSLVELRWEPTARLIKAFTAPPAAAMPPKPKENPLDDEETRDKFVALLQEMPETGTVKISYVSIQLRPLATSLRKLFRSAGWVSYVSTFPMQPEQITHDNGLTIVGSSEYFLDQVIYIFRECGFDPIHRIVLSHNIRATHPRWPAAMTQIRVEVCHL